MLDWDKTRYRVEAVVFRGKFNCTLSLSDSGRCMKAHSSGPEGQGIAGKIAKQVLGDD